ncbi:MAG TPA: 4'-phosphopantetheinyl transferase superfamily protein [Anaerovoracaceae bacterium]|nr:4'-phosphopantetheinyl transferase superfamily protein [Anaerovoracaceae bacterium]
MYLYLYHNEGPKSRFAFSERLVRRALLDYAARQELGIPDKILINAAIAKEEKGKPYFADLREPDGKGRPAVHYSVSHSGDWWGCLMAGEPVGFDMEVCRDKVNYEKIAKRYFTEDEYGLVLSAGPEAFFDVWVRKEAYVKYSGSGLSVGLDSFSVVEGGKLVPQVIATDKARNRPDCIVKSCITRPCEVGDGVKAAYCSAGGNSLKDIISIQ